MKHRKYFHKMNRVKVAGAACLGAAIASALLVGSVSFETHSLAAVVFGLCAGIVAWALYYNAQPDDVKDSIYPLVGTQAMIKAVVVVTVISAFVLSFAEAPILKLMGGAGLASVVGGLIAQLLFNDD